VAIDKINLRKLLQLFFADERQRRSLLLKDIRNDRSKKAKDHASGGDFFGPFWADVKAHVGGDSNIVEQTKSRIAANKTRERLYPALRDSFLEMWDDRMRWRNEPFTFAPESVKGQLPIEGLGTVKIENTASIQTWDGSYRIIYPYFCEAPALPQDGARLGFWALTKALPQHSSENFRIIDFHRRAYFRPAEVGLSGNEEAQFTEKYDSILKQWRKLRDER
jgi:hypothetical protein